MGEVSRNMENAFEPGGAYRIGVDIGGTYVNAFHATCRLP